VVQKDTPRRIIEGPRDSISTPNTGAVSHPWQPTVARSSAFNFGWLLFSAVFVGLLVAAATALALRTRARSLSNQLLERTPDDTAKKQFQKWEDHIADKLRIVNQTRSAPPIVSPAALTVGLLRELEWKRFELVVQRYYSATGVRAELTCAGADGGIDVKLFHSGEDHAFSYVQCKAWGTNKVNIRLVREFFGVMAADKVEQGVLITTSDFWPDARVFANANGIATLTAEDFVTMFAALSDTVRASIIAEVTDGDYTTPSCPACEVKAVRRERKRDGVKFWSCGCGWTMTARAESTAG
jgi:restriction system protein